MFDNGFIDYLYTRVLHEDIMKSGVNTQDIIIGIENMKKVYTRNSAWLTSESAPLADFNKVAYRCAYIHKYAPLHTAIVYDVIKRALNNNYMPFKNMVLRSACLRICSLGGGPGCDVLGALAAMHEIFGFLRVSVSIIDIMINWNFTFRSIIHELELPTYGTLGQSFNPQYFDWDYISSNLTGEMNEQVYESIAAADLITMVKFVSATACETTSDMIKEIFRSMKPGAIVLYVDNDVGKFHELINQAALSCSFVAVFGPFKRKHYCIEDFKKKRFGYTSCFDIKVTIHMWQKPMRHPLPPTSRSTLISNMQCGKSHNFSSFTDVFSSESSSLSNEYPFISLPMNYEACLFSEEQNNNYKNPSFFANNTPSIRSYETNGYLSQHLSKKKNEQNGSCNKKKRTKTSFASKTLKSFSSRSNSRTVQSNLKHSLCRKMFKNSSTRSLSRNSSSQQNELSSKKKNTSKLRRWLANFSNRITNFRSFSYKCHPQVHHTTSSPHLLRYRSFNDSLDRRVIVTQSLNETVRRVNSTERFEERPYRNVINDISDRRVVLYN
ncbi:uncharacterized protein LOC118184810 [Stegodyphus dumicola]|uniref:uncharacterized protein LOC118184810 n=1 Tax=Stegodyphus dumicola TaxID=202533 RepID=UPI0015A858DE|nr:uncharacterized protein LOC118184810 [Stegodyphus dumicola]